MNARYVITAISLSLIWMPSLCEARAPETGSNDEVLHRLERMEQQLDALRDGGLVLRRELDHLRSETGEHWLTERRTAEIRTMVQDVLADADTRASLLGDGITAGWAPGSGFFLMSNDNRSLLRIEGQMQVRYVYNYHESPRVPLNAEDLDQHLHGFENSRTRLAFSGHVYSPMLQYYVRGDFARDRSGPADVSPRGSFQLLDAYVRHHFNDEVSVRFGQFKVPFSREYLVSSAKQLGVERSVVGTNMALGHTQGLELRYWSGPWRVTGSYNVGAQQLFAGEAMTGTGAAFSVATTDRFVINTAALTRQVEYGWSGRAEFLAAGEWAQFDDFTSPMHESFGMLFGAAIHGQRTEAGTPGGGRFFWLAWTVDASIEFGGANLYASFTHHYIDNPNPFTIDIYGVTVQGGFYLTPKWEVFARWEFGTWEFPAPPGNERFLEDLHIISTGFNYYLDGHDAKWTTDIGVALNQVTESWARPPGAGNRPSITGWRAEGDGAKRQIVFRTQFQLLF